VDFKGAGRAACGVVYTSEKRSAGTGRGSDSGRSDRVGGAGAVLARRGYPTGWMRVSHGDKLCLQNQ